MEEKSIATLPANLLPLDHRGVETLSVLDMGFLIVVSAMIISAIATLIYAFIPKRVQQYLFSLKLPHQAKCPHCRYFSHNSYLKCTVHPSTVLTDQAINCLDYSPHNQVKLVEED
ncbi:MAG: hypothetical protein V7K64_28500 [Nostoc sp.]|uniref:hypothetical protein n=1 Tax=Nostoc sp. TaxID=1180 RepID=UPI002FFB26AF